jgi:hypothetical protein
LQQKEREDKEKESKRALQLAIEGHRDKLVHDLAEFDQAIMYSPQETCDSAKPRVLHTYNVCGDKALHICMLVAYSYAEDSPEREALLDVVKKLIKKFDNRARDADGKTHRWAFGNMIGLFISSFVLIFLFAF